MKRPRLLLLVVAILPFGCSHIRPPDDYSWNDKSGDPGGIDRATAAQWNFQDFLSEDFRRQTERDFKQNLPQLPKPR